MNKVITHRQPDLVLLAGVIEMICGTLIKSHKGIVEALSSRILPAYDREE